MAAVNMAKGVWATTPPRLPKKPVIPDMVPNSLSFIKVPSTIFYLRIHTLILPLLKNFNPNLKIYIKKVISNNWFLL